jgi:hypothetical protein
MLTQLLVAGFLQMLVISDGNMIYVTRVISGMVELRSGHS